MVEEMQTRYVALKEARVRDIRSFNLAAPSGRQLPWRHGLDGIPESFAISSALAVSFKLLE